MERKKTKSDWKNIDNFLSLRLFFLTLVFPVNYSIDKCRLVFVFSPLSLHQCCVTNSDSRAAPQAQMCDRCDGVQMDKNAKTMKIPFVICHGTTNTGQFPYSVRCKCIQHNNQSERKKECHQRIIVVVILWKNLLKERKKENEWKTSWGNSRNI